MQPPNSHEPLEGTEESTKAADAEAENRRQQDDRRARPERRRSAIGLFELRAKRDRVVEDRRQTERRSGSRFKFAFWRLFSRPFSRRGST